ncbi:MAG: hypothetical protein OER56_12925 [Hyphomicrobiales bacterium]|nr:hypothetical protein [Hyphomicrobiales bacterium]
MSGTRLHSHAAPVTDLNAKPTLLIVAHGERGGAGDDQFVHRLVNSLQRLPQYASVRTCFISKEPSLSRVFKGLPPGPVVIYPLFMSDGYFVKQAIPRSIEMDGAKIGAEPERHPAVILTPVGLNPHLPRLVANLVERTARDLYLPMRDCHLLLAAHGSKHDGASRRATLAVAEALKKEGTVAGIEVGFLEEQPFLDDQITKIKGPVIAVGLFASEGMHGAIDLPESVRRSGRNDVSLSPPITQGEGLMGLICNDLASVALTNRS